MHCCRCNLLQCVLQLVAVCSSVLQCVDGVLYRTPVCCSVTQCVAVGTNMFRIIMTTRQGGKCALQCVAVCGIVWQRVAACCSVL